MPPILTPGEITQLTKDRDAQQNSSDVLTGSIPAKNARLVALQVSDGGFSKFFVFYNNDIIAHYDAEYRKLDGRFITAPIVEADIIGPSNLDFAVRTTPITPTTDITRIAEFDGGGIDLIPDPLNETQHILEVTTQISNLSSFTNSERTSKITDDPGDQATMNAAISALELAMSNRVLTLDAQDAALGLNQDVDATSEISSQINLNNISRLYIQNYLITTDISNTGFSSLNAEKSIRGTEISTRISQINTNYIGQSENYYDKRYNTANDRGNLLRGTLRQIVVSQESLQVTQDYANTAQAAADSITSILP